MEFRGIVKLDRHTADQLGAYLVEKESDLGLKIIHSVGITQANDPELERANAQSLKVGEAVFLFAKKVRNIFIKKQLLTEKGHTKKIATEINKHCWQYVEILENSVSEIFLQIKLMDITDLKESAWDAAFAIKLTLMHHIEDLEWALKRLNAQIASLQTAEDGGNIILRFRHIFSRPGIDPSLLTNLQNCKKYLSFQYGKFHDEYVNYQIINKDVRKHLLKLVDYQALNQLDNVSKDTFKKLYELVKIWESNQKSKLIPMEDLKRPLRESMDSKRVSHIFEEYHNVILNELFQRSRSLKFYSQDLLHDEALKFDIESSLESTLKEIHTLAATTRNYREFLLKTDPDPYIRYRFGFGDWLIGKEPAITQNMSLLSYELDETNQLALNLIDSVKNASFDTKKIDVSEIRNKIDKPLHEMSQPLIGKDSMVRLAAQIVEELKKVNELGTLDIHVVDFVGNILSKLLKSDWKYHVLFNMPDFEKMYSTHIGIANNGDRAHVNRLNEFRRLCKEIKDIGKQKSFSLGAQDIEFHLNDIKGSLQDFLGYVQRAVSDRENSADVIKNIRFQLLEYRYFFGNYFHEQELSETDLQSVRNKFLFVDQYLDAVDDLVGW
jgi:hypothetical protein